MSFSHHALYNCLLADLSEWLSPSVSNFETAGAEPFSPDMTYEQFAALALAKSFFKKFKDGSVAADAREAAYNKFLLSNIRCRDWSLTGVHTSGDEELIGLFKQQLYNFYYHRDEPLLDSQSIVNAGRTGPGASIGTRGDDFYTKLFSSPMTCTSEGLLTMYKCGVRASERWTEAERLRSSEFGDATLVVGNKLDFVPKNVHTMRSICVEPNLNMFLQLGVCELVKERLKRAFGIDLATQQDINRALARNGSYFDNLCTIDLESASDSIALSMVEECFPSDFTSWLRLLRCPETTYLGKRQELYMLSSMGNGFTFPIQTMIYCCVVAASYASINLKLRRSSGEHLGNFGVYGDDIIVTKEARFPCFAYLNS